MIAKTVVVICLLAVHILISDASGSSTPGTPAPGTPARGTPAPGTPAAGTPAPGTPVTSEPHGPKTYKACTKTDGQSKGECVPYYLCSKQSRPSDIIDVHYPSDEPCDSYLDECCSASDRIQPKTETKVNDPPQ